jgi:hypothetical protein
MVSNNILEEKKQGNGGELLGGEDARSDAFEQIALGADDSSDLIDGGGVKVVGELDAGRGVQGDWIAGVAAGCGRGKLLRFRRRVQLPWETNEHSHPHFGTQMGLGKGMPTKTPVVHKRGRT